jgi:putative endopeptidase
MVPASRYTRFAGLALVAALAATFAPAAAQVQTKPIDPANLDTTCLPCKTFYRYANGGWMARATIPNDQSSWGSFNELKEQNYAALHQILDEAVAQRTTDPDRLKLARFYGTCMDSARAETDGLRPLAAEFRRIAAIERRSDIVPALVQLHWRQIPVLFSFSATPDAKHSARTIAELYQGGLSLPDRDYYLKTDSASVVLRNQYVDHVQRMLRIAGDDSLAAATQARELLDFETTLARASMTREQQRDPEAVYHLTKTTALRRSAPKFAWTEYFTGLGLPRLTELNIAQPEFVTVFDSLIAAAPIATWRAYLRWKLLAAAAPMLSTPFAQESFRFNSTVLEGTPAMRPRWKRCLARTDDALSEILGKAYVRQHFTPETKARALQMVRNIQAEFRARLTALTWMSPETKTKAFRKLETMVVKIGYPDRWRDYSKLQLASGPFVLNQMRANIFETRRTMAKVGRPTDRTEWGMSPPTVNAYYSASTNEIVFPAGIMQPPFFDPKADDAVNYGGMGAVIGHEITHGFDDEGRKFDADGNLSGWWSDEDNRAFNTRADVLRQQFDSSIAIDSLHVNGKLTLGENIADLGGLLIAHGAYKRSLTGSNPAPIDGLTGDQRFFLAWAQIWRAAVRPEYARLLVTVDPHAPRHLRAAVPLANIPVFAEAFHCQAGDTMMRPAESRAQIW